MTCNWLIFISLVSAISLSSCSPEQEFNELPNGDRWKLLAFDEQRQRLDSAGQVTVHIAKLSHPDGDTLYHSAHATFTPGSGPMWDFLTTRFVTDSLMYLCAEASAFDGTGGADSLRYYLRLLRMRTKASLRDARHIELLRLDSLMRHDTIAGRYAEYKGIWIRSISPGDTTPVRDGREVAIHYQGRTLQGTVVDDSRLSGGLLRFVKGNELQVLEGIDLALERMHRGETAEVIIPSWLAFGANGSGAGIVPPYSTLVYTLQIRELSDY